MARSEEMYGSAVKTEPSAAELEAARLGFAQMLRRKRFSARFIDSNAEDLLARARFEYSRALARGEQIRSPAGWLIHCAWRRTQNLLASQAAEPTFVAEEAVGTLADEASPTPEQAAIDSDRAERIAAAVAQLSAEQRTLIELSYFEGMSVREAGRFLHWHSSKAQRCHEAALRRLRELLGIRDLDELAIEIGLAAWVSLASGEAARTSIPAGVEALADAGGQAAGGAWARAQDIARRVLLGGGAEPSGAMAAGGAARTAGVCGAAALACLAGGVVGPGVGGVGPLLGGEAPPQRAAEPAVVATQSPERGGESETATVRSEAPETASGKFGGAEPGQEPEPRVAPQGQADPQTSTPSQQATAEFSPFAGEEGAAPPPSEAPAPPVARGGAVGGSGSSGAASSGSSTQGAAAEGEFGLK